MKLLRRINLVIPLVFLLLIVLGAWLGREDIVESCDDTGTFEQSGITYTCEKVE